MALAIDNLERRKKALMISGGMFSVLLISLFFFEIYYEAPEEEFAMGVDLNYGLDLTGYGDIQTTNKASASQNDYDVAPADEATAPQEVASPEQAVPQPAAPQPQTTRPTPQRTPPVITSEAEKSPVVMKKTPTRTTTTPAKTAPVKPNPAPPKPARTVDTGSVMKKSGSSSNSNGTTGSRSGVGGNSNGDGAPGTVGDQGDPRGTPDGKSLYGNPGSGGSGGASVSISGWNRKSFSLPKDNTAETGRIVFRVTVDNRGDVIAIVPTSSTLSPSVTNFYRSYIQRNLSRFLSPQGTPPNRSSGTITINITN